MRGTIGPKLVILVGTLALGACAERSAVPLRSPETEHISLVCGPLHGAEGAIREAQESCVASYRQSGGADASGS